MTEKPGPRGRPVTNKIERIPAPPEDIVKAIFRAGDKKVKPRETEG
jgi:hypothetical protein